MPFRTMSPEIGTAISAGLTQLQIPMRAIAATQPIEQHVTALLASTPLPTDAQRQECLRACLFLVSGDLHKAHEICQNVPTAHGSALHAIVHRLEADYWNAKYWWRRASGVTFDDLPAAIAAELPSLPAALTSCVDKGRYHPPAFVDLVERHADDNALRPALLTIQRLELTSLMVQCVQD